MEMVLCCRAFWRSFAKFVDTNEDGLISKAELKNFLCEPIPTAACSILLPLTRTHRFGSGPIVRLRLRSLEHSHALRALRTFLQSDPRSRGHRALLGRVFGRTHAQVPVDRAIDQLVASEESVIGFKECPVSQPDMLFPVSKSPPQSASLYEYMRT